MLDIREVLAQNLKINRRKRGLTQEKLAEKASISAHYLAMVEVARKFPSPEMLERLAVALGIETHRLFEVSTTPEEALSLLRREIVNEMTQLAANMERVVAKTIQETLAGTCIDKPRGK
jgi:transcriptional regulator with XRE-family HTH domain